MPAILIAFPLDYSSLLLAQKLDKNISNDITFYLDSQISNEFMDVIVNELRSLKRDPVTTTSSQDWSSFDMIVFANINVYPDKSDATYAKMVNNLFTKHLSNLKLKDDAVMFLGQNYRGLIAAQEIGKVHPRLKKNLFVYSSILRASITAYGLDRATYLTRHLPDIGGTFFSLTSLHNDNNEKIDYLIGNWTFGSFCLLEAETLYTGITNHIDNDGGFEDLEFIGKFPSDDEARKYGIKKDLPVFMSVMQKQEEKFIYKQYLKKTNTYFESQYSI